MIFSFVTFVKKLDQNGFEVEQFEFKQWRRGLKARFDHPSEDWRVI